MGKGGRVDFSTIFGGQSWRSYPEIGPGIIGRVVAKAQRKYFDPPTLSASKYD